MFKIRFSALCLLPHASRQVDTYKRWLITASVEVLLPATLFITFQSVLNPEVPQAWHTQLPSVEPEGDSFSQKMQLHNKAKNSWYFCALLSPSLTLSPVLTQPWKPGTAPDQTQPSKKKQTKKKRERNVSFQLFSCIWFSYPTARETLKLRDQSHRRSWGKNHFLVMSVLTSRETTQPVLL